MAHVVSNPHSGADFHKATGFFANLYQRWVEYRNYRDTKEQLSALSDHELRDLGIERGSINEIARQG